MTLPRGVDPPEDTARDAPGAAQLICMPRLERPFELTEERKFSLALDVAWGLSYLHTRPSTCPTPGLWVVSNQCAPCQIFQFCIDSLPSISGEGTPRQSFASHYTWEGEDNRKCLSTGTWHMSICYSSETRIQFFHPVATQVFPPARQLSDRLPNTIGSRGCYAVCLESPDECPTLTHTQKTHTQKSHTMLCVLHRALTLP